MWKPIFIRDKPPNSLPGSIAQQWNPLKKANGGEVLCEQTERNDCCGLYPAFPKHKKGVFALNRTFPLNTLAILCPGHYFSPLDRANLALISIHTFSWRTSQIPFLPFLSQLILPLIRTNRYIPFTLQFHIFLKMGSKYRSLVWH